MTKKQKSLAAVLTLLCFFVSNLSGFAAPQIQTAGGFSDVQGVSTFEINIPSDLGTIENLHSGSGPALIHIQTAHGNYEAQKKIQGILEYLKQNYGVKLVLLEGSSFKFDSEYLRFFPDQMNVTRDIADRLTKQALVKGAELFLMDNPDVQAYGIEKLETYRANGDAFKAVLTQQQKTEGFLQGMNMQIERLTSPYLNKDLRSFLARLDDFEAKKVPLMDWVSFLRGQTEKFLNIDLSDAAYQVDWPMMVRLFTLSEFEKKMDMAAYGQEKTGFLQAIKAVPADTRAQIEKLLNSPISRHQLADPETGILFERMVSALPQDFDFSKFPNVKLFIGHLILQSEIHSDVLMAEMDRLVEKISVRLAQTPEEKKLLSILSDYRLLKKLFALELTPGDYDKLVVRGGEARPDRVAESFLEINGSKRVKDIKFEHLEDINLLQERALEFYRLVKERDNAMTANIEDRLKKEGVDKAVVITGGFHAQPFEDFFASQGYAYALISPKITSLEGDTGRKAYVNSILQNRNYIKQTYESPSGVSHTAAETAQVGADPYYIAPFIISDADAAFAAQGNPLNLEQLGTSLGATRWFQEQFGGVSLGYVNEGPATAVEVRYPTGVTERLATSQQVITRTRLAINPAVTSAAGNTDAVQSSFNIPQEQMDRDFAAAISGSSTGQKRSEIRGLLLTAALLAGAAVISSEAPAQEVKPAIEQKKEATPAEMIAAVKKGTSAERQAAAENIAAAIEKNKKDPKYVQTLVKGLVEGLQVMDANINQIGKEMAADKANEKAEELVKRADAENNTSAALKKALVAGGDTSVDALIEVLKDDKIGARVLSSTASVLGELKAKKAAPALAAAFKTQYGKLGKHETAGLNSRYFYSLATVSQVLLREIADERALPDVLYVYGLETKATGNPLLHGNIRNGLEKILPAITDQKLKTQVEEALKRSEMRVLPAGITPDEESWGPLYASGEIVQEPVKGNIRATQRGEVPAIRTMSPEERAFYTKVFVEAARRGWVASMILTGGAGTRMPLNSYPPALRTPLSQRFELVTRNQGWQVVNSQPFGEKDEMLLSLLVTAEGYQQQSQVMGSPEFKTKGLIPAVEIGGRWKTFLGLDALNMARFLQQLGIPKEKMPYIAALGADNQVAIKRFLEAGGFADKLDIVTYVGYPGKRVVAHEKDTAAVIAGLKKKRGDNQGRLDRNEYRDLSEKGALEKENALLDQQLADLDTDAYREYARLNAGKVLPVAAPRGHGGILHNMFNDYSNQELILKLAKRGTKFVFMRNIDNTVARKDEDWAVFMGYMIASHFDLLLQGSLRPEGQSGGAFITHLDRPGQPVQSAEDPSLKGTSVNPKEAPFINNAVAGAAILDYMTQVYHTSRRELAEIARIRDASVRHAREAEIRSRGFGRYPINPVPKVVQITNHPEHPLNGKWVVGTGVETNMWESSGIVTDAAPIEVELAQERIEVSAIINGAEQDVANQARRSRQYGSPIAEDIVAARVNYEALLRTALSNLDQSIVSRNEQNRDWHQAEIDYLLAIQKQVYSLDNAAAINGLLNMNEGMAQLEIRRRAQTIYERRTEPDGANGVVGRPVQTTRVSAVEVGSVEDIRNYLRRKLGLGAKDKVTNQMVEEYLERIKGTADYDEFLQELRWVNFAPTKDWNDYEGINAEILKFVAPLISTGTLIRSEMRLSREAVTPEKKRRELMGEEADENGLLTPVGEMRPIQEIDRDILTAEQVEKAPTGPRGPEEVGDPLRRNLEIQTPGAMPRPQTTNTRTRAGVVAGAGISNQVSDAASGVVNVTVTGIRRLEQGETTGGDQVRIYSAPLDADSVAALLGSPYLPPSLRSFWAAGSSPVGEGPALLLAEVGEGKEIEFVGFDRPFVPVSNMPPAVNPARIAPILEQQPDNIIPKLGDVTVAVTATGLNIRPLLNGRPTTISLSPIRNLNVNPSAAVATRSELRDIAALLDQAAPSNSQGQVNNVPTRIAALEGLVPDRRIPQTPLNTAAVPGLIRLIAANEDREIADRLTLALISNIPAVINDVNIILDAGQRLQLADALRTDGVKAIAADRIKSGKADLADVKFILGLISVSNIPAFALDNSAALIATAKVLAGIAADETALRNDRLVALQALAFVLPVITASNDIRSEKLGQVLAGIVTKQAAKTAENKLDQNYFLNAANAALTALGEQGVEELLPIIVQPQIPFVLAEILRLRRLPVTPLVEIASSNTSSLQQKIAALDTLKRFADRATAVNPSAVESSVKPSDAISIAALVANPKNSEAFRVDAARVLGTLGTAAAPALSILSSINPAAEAQPQQLATLGTVLAQAIVDIRGRSELRNYVAEAVSPSPVSVDAELPAPGVNQNTAAGRISRSSLTVTTQFTAFIIRFRTQLAVFVQQGPQVLAAIVSEVLGREAYAATIPTGQPVASLDEIAPVGSYQITPKFYTDLPGVKVPGTATGEGIGRELFEYGLLKLLAKDNSEALVSLLKGFSDLQPAGQKQLLAVFLPQGVTKDDFYKMLAASIRNKNSGLASTADQQALIDKLELFIEAMPLLPGQTEVEESNAYVAANKGVARIGSGVVEGVKGAAQLGIDNDIDLRDSRQAIAVVLAAISMKRAADLIHGIENDLIRGQVLSNYVAQHLDGLEQDGSGFKLTRKNIGQLLRFLYAVQAYVETRA